MADDLFGGQINEYYVLDDKLPCGLSFNELKEELEVNIYEGWAKRKKDAERGFGRGGAKAGDLLPAKTHVRKKWVRLSHIIWTFAHDGQWPKNFIDHIDDNRRNNTISNLRIVDRSQNMMNSALKRNNTSGVSGIYWNWNLRKWHARIKVEDRGNIHLGFFITLDDAIRARYEAEDKYYGEFSRRASRGEKLHWTKPRVTQDLFTKIEEFNENG